MLAQNLVHGDALTMPHPRQPHAFWFVPHVAACHATANLLAKKQNTF